MNKQSFLNKKKYLAHLTLAVWLSAAPALQAYSDGSRSTPDSTATSAATRVNANDQALSRRIGDKIHSGWFSRAYERVNVQVNNGAVILQGSVKTQADKDKVEKEVRDIKGVKSLTSHITVQEARAKERKDKRFPQDRSATPADEQLNKKIRDNVSKGWLWDSYKDVSLNTSNGNVILRGTIRSESDKQDLINEVQKIEGVRSVRSELRIESGF